MPAHSEKCQSDVDFTHGKYSEGIGFLGVGSGFCSLGITLVDEGITMVLTQRYYIATATRPQLNIEY